jgi:hypothetical protein
MDKSQERSASTNRKGGKPGNAETVLNLAISLAEKNHPEGIQPGLGSAKMGEGILPGGE